MNFTENAPVLELPAEVGFKNHELLLSNYDVDTSENIRRVVLRPYEARVYWLG